MALSASTAASPISSAYISAVTTPPYTTSVAFDWALACLQWAAEGQLSGGGGVAGSEDNSIIFNFFNNLTGNTNPEAFATAMANYWSTCLLVPAGNATLVVNDAASQVASFQAAIEASIGITEQTPYFQHLFQNIQNIALPSITWTVTRATTPVSTTFETVS